jgi:DDE superfamily endonuclease/Helix-turn-helix of DDE superfamily endonuclease
VALSHRICTGLPHRALSKLLAELAPAWTAQQESRLADQRGRPRLRAAGAGPEHELVFVDRVITTLVILRFQLPHAALALFYGVHRSTITRAVGEIRPLLAMRGFAVPGKPGLRLRTLADVFAYAAAEGIKLRLDGTDVQVRRPKAGKPGRRAFVSGKKKQHTKKPTVISDGAGRLLWAGAIRPGRMHDVTAVRSEGIEEQLRRYPQVQAEVDSGYQGLARDFPAQVSAPPTRPGHHVPPQELAVWEHQRKAQSSQRICVEHAIAEPKQWRSLQRYIGRREYFDETFLAIAGLVSDRTALR